MADAVGQGYVEFRNGNRPNRADLPSCPVQVCAQLMGTKWKILILRDLLEGTKRFGELRKSVTGISQKVLTGNLRELEDAGLVARRVYPEVPPRVEYLLTETGESIRPVIESMRLWGESYLASSLRD
ncbi:MULTISPECIES: winged helix-turn-helix transcriptional regulator [Atopobiaceae]|uniref:Transcriptional regulator, HxlR family n=1 Tax=Parafannyhessea umbonata TaxID=604330 RepID=A0A1H9MY51_9ACTN|nr:transcriptional regulator, HxlR family [Parafannyhessea umbonata]SER28598.1 transcriptional regulator, HxlR family [Parafannyhessea umbonata]SJZ37614.1 transcriptional regulator, HxlR family [Olsenella sp. KH1P3]